VTSQNQAVQDAQLITAAVGCPDDATIGSTLDAIITRQAFEVAQRMAAIVEGSDDAIVGGSLDGLVTSWNPAAERMYGYTSQEIIGQPARVLTPLDRKSEIDAVLAKIRAGRQVERLQTQRVRKDGAAFPVSLTVSPIRDAAGTIVGTSVIHRDLTGLERAARYARVPSPTTCSPGFTGTGP